MKYITLVTSLALSASALLTTGCMIDVPTGAYQEQSSNDGDFREKVHRLRAHYERVMEEVNTIGRGKHLHGEMADIDAGIHRVASFVFSGQFVPERAQANISSLHERLRAVSEQARQ
jgi:hypothetical protein